MFRIQDNFSQSASAQTSAFNGPSIRTNRAVALAAQLVVVGTFTGTAVIQTSQDNINWITQGTPLSIGAGGNFPLEKANMCWNYSRIAYAVTVGTMTSVNTIISIMTDEQ